ncbi:DeoR/GlpR family DNA-binding transcription regulator [Paracraurococcus ruber]|uniref:DeoR family transcriptional regulator n=1 Tax=Paracraurococcus ruber TaxID=77675 RepID=A0ABS1CUM2_9PROT|nr:DeoR/GlpR family DNA-binding transcription regulator [Paracraurococcus ruber]MBK1657921.1 DeoR family transcriptional regulator [Paracraurococcus ruber]TDG33113.1 DeoR/GlpR transcriptional regulator [Paracraurococcus ruber]
MSGPFPDALSDRQQAILALARGAGRVGVEELAGRFGVSPQTIRKDLNTLCDRRLLARQHGGAILSSGTENLAYAARRALAHEEKRRIAARCAALIPDGSSLFINIGTTTEEVARALANHRDLLVVTNNIHVVGILLPAEGVEVVVAGGPVRRADGGIVGEATVDLVSQFKLDFAVIGASALDEDGSLLDFDYREVRVARAILANARQAVLVADAGKFDRSAPVRIGHVAQLQAVVLDRRPPARFAEACRAAGTRLLLAEETPPESTESDIGAAAAGTAA